MSDPLALIEAHVAALEAAALEEGTDLPSAPELAELTLGPDQLDAARELLARLDEATARLTGLRRRVRGEIEGSRRPRVETARRAPRVVDVVA